MACNADFYKNKIIEELGKQSVNAYKDGYSDGWSDGQAVMQKELNSGEFSNQCIDCDHCKTQYINGIVKSIGCELIIAATPIPPDFCCKWFIPIDLEKKTRR